jgi:23S rRNA (pseudouridine1915-N3)-methyltransferase
MKILLSPIRSRQPLASSLESQLLSSYLDRATRYISCSLRTFPSEATLLDSLTDTATRTRPALVLADSRGQQLSSEEIAKVFGFFRDGGIQQLFFGIGPADGWSTKALARADKTIAFGRITLPHELAAAVAAEQIYRALTILSGHPYHIGH